MQATNCVNTEQGELRARLAAAIEKAEAYCQRLQVETAAASTADKGDQQPPYQVLGIAFGIGVWFGFLAMRGGRD